MSDKHVDGWILSCIQWVLPLRVKKVQGYDVLEESPHGTKLELVRVGMGRTLELVVRWNVRYSSGDCFWSECVGYSRRACQGNEAIHQWTEELSVIERLSLLQT